MSERKCTKELCDDSHCVRAQVVKALFEDDHPDETDFEIIAFMEKIIEDGKCQKPEELKVAVEELRDRFIS